LGIPSAVVALALVALVGYPLLAFAGAPAANATVDMENTAFVPANVTVTVGSTVTWVNKDPVPHTATADNGSFDVVLLPGESGSATFNTAGTFSYFCRPHPWMVGSVRVVGEGPDQLPETGDPIGGSTVPLAGLAGAGLLLLGGAAVFLRRARAN
jgi:plastocyanin